MLRIHFSSNALSRTRFADGPDPMWEASLSMHQLRTRATVPLLGQWKQRVTHELRPEGALRARVALPIAINPPLGYFPDFLTPYGAHTGFEAGLDTVLSTPKPRLRREIGLLTVAGSALRSTVAGIGDGCAKALGALGEGLRHYHRVALAPLWPRLQATVQADLARRKVSLARGGWAEVFDRLHPCARFSGSVMEISLWGATGDRDIYLDDDGLMLIPSFFKDNRQLMVLADPDLPPVLVYPVDPEVRAETEAAHQNLAALLGPTRADVLAAAGFGGSTSVIASRIGISVAAASKHLAVMRQTGLVSSARDRNTVFHTTTPLGRALLGGQ